MRLRCVSWFTVHVYCLRSAHCDTVSFGLADGLIHTVPHVYGVCPIALQWRDVRNVPRKVRHKIQEARVFIKGSVLRPLEPRARRSVRASMNTGGRHDWCNAKTICKVGACDEMYNRNK